MRKLLAKAEATDNPNEAEAFSAKAAQLIAAHRLDPSRLAASTADERLAVRTLAIGRGAYVRARLALLGAIAAHHGCELVWQFGGDGTTAHLAGFVSDLDPTVVLYESLHLQAASQMATLRRTTPAATQRWRRAFLFGFAARVADLLGDAHQRAEADHASATGPPATLLPALQARQHRVRQHAAASFGPTAAARTPRPAVAGGWDHGHRAAGSADIGRRRLVAQPALGPGTTRP